MKTVHSNLAKIFFLALAISFGACSETEDPVPDDPNQPDTINPGLPGGGLPGGGGNNPGGGLPGGGGNNPGNGPLGGGGQQPTNNDNVIGMLSAGGSTYDFTGFTPEAEAQPNAQGAYPVYLGYYDEASAADGQFDLFDTGSTALFIYNATRAGVIEADSYSLANSPFNGLFFGIQGYGYILADGNINVEATQTAGQLLISITGNVVEVAEVNGELSIVSEELIPVEAQFAALAQTDPNARYAAGIDMATETFSFELVRK